MKHNSIKVEVLVFSDAYSNGMTQRKFVKWLKTILLPVIDRQQGSSKKIFLSMLQNTSPIYLS